MYQIKCPQGHPIPVSPTAAGSTVVCPECGQEQQVPRLGDLRQLPRADQQVGARRRRSLPFGARITFSILLLVALVAGITAGYAGLRWQNLPVPLTTEEHIAATREEMANLPPAALIGIWEHFEHGGLGERSPFPYVRLQETRDGWKRICLVGLGVAGACVAVAIAVVILGRKSASATDT